MRAVQLEELTGPEGLRLVEVAEPVDSTGVVIDLHAAGVCFPDLLQTTGSHQMARVLPCVLGLEGAGIVRSAPAGSGLSPGKRVAVLTTEGGSWQRTVVADASSVFSLPDSVSLAAGSGFLVNYLTAHFALDERARYRVGETVLVHGAAGGLGIAALHVATALGLETIAVVSAPEKAEIATESGATHVVLTDGWKERVQQITKGRGVDVILDPVGGDRFTDSLRSLAPNGRLIVLGFAGGEIPTVKVNRLLLKNISVMGAGWGGYLKTDPGYLARQWNALYPLLESGVLQVPEPTLYPLARAVDALTTLKERSAIGKVALSFE
ncbi:NADPH:quinone oxidoreductase family protein [Rhodococcus sp. IEGM 1379]|uniref:NADPH:quinone oxidoreductase family protein n=1 Tax=Rhodococcus sp. IEGM 1379 TaxID=3047086 RepID=UPI0024B6E13A|nr:NADPH:quinone oxidoreductase family protein [Rhodococcus sp. IEGM 1379]MDI9917301.1 NADPH:quinone oxidoreductase family protein [Rhodococcus sp. IEGM 1379]